MDVREALGRAVGGILAPIVAEASLTRGAPVFHADGVVLEAEAEAIERIGEAVEGIHRGSVPASTQGSSVAEALVALGAALHGPALVRFSNAGRRYQEGQDPPDTFGAAIRFGAGTAKQQDLVFATFRHLWELPLAAFRTDPRDFLANDYYTALPSRIPGTSALVEFRLVADPGVHEGRDHVDRLLRAVADGKAFLTLEGRAKDGGRFVPIATIKITARARVDQLDANPLRSGAGIVPAGFFQAVRSVVYPASMLGASIAKGPGV
jgi:hypothetical protein